jgi:hypothetical protein
MGDWLVVVLTEQHSGTGISGAASPGTTAASPGTTGAASPWTTDAVRLGTAGAVKPRGQPARQPTDGRRPQTRDERGVRK